MIESMSVSGMAMTFLTSAIVPIALLTIVAFVLQVVLLACAAHLSRGDDTRRVGALVAGTLLLGLGLGGAPALRAQEEMPQFEARYTRVFGSDTVQAVWQRLSPDGRWIAFSSFLNAEQTNGIWLVSTEGGEPIQLTTGKWDIHAAWFPTSDRIAFTSTKLDETMIMTQAIEPETGNPTGPPQRITLESGSGPEVSPDGRWIAFRAFAQGVETHMVIKIVPARGGSTRTLVQLPGRPSIKSWSMDGRHLYFYWRPPEVQSGMPDLMRVSIDGGESEKVTVLPDGDAALYNPYIIYRGSDTDASGGPLYVIATADFHALGQVSLPKNVANLGHARRVTADGKRVVAVVSNTVTPLRVLPVAGGPGRQLGDARADDVPIGWTPDGQRVVFLTEVDGRVAVLAAPVAEGAAQEYTVIPDLPMTSYQRPVLMSADGRYLAFHGRSAGGDLSPLVIARVSDGETRTVSEASTRLQLFGISGPRGPATWRDQFLYLEARGKTAELRAASFDGGSHLIRTFPAAARRAAGVFGDRVVWAEGAGDSTEIMLAEGPEGEARRLAVFPATFEELVWSPDGRWIAGGAYFGNASEPDFRILLIGVGETGEVVSSPRLLDTEIGVGWGIRWLPDSQGLTVFAQSLPSYRTDVWKFSLREGESPVALTKDETSDFWYYSLAPDGGHIAYPAEVPRGSSIWLVEMEDAAVQSQ